LGFALIKHTTGACAAFGLIFYKNIKVRYQILINSRLKIISCWEECYLQTIFDVTNLSQKLLFSENRNKALTFFNEAVRKLD